jgi:hypothetical protein
MRKSFTSNKSIFKIQSPFLLILFQFIMSSLRTSCKNFCLNILGFFYSESKINEGDCAFGFSESLNKTCAICLENVITKQLPSDQMFGLMTNCKHIFCLRCIRQWRSKRKDFSETVIRYTNCYLDNN